MESKFFLIGQNSLFNVGIFTSFLPVNDVESIGRSIKLNEPKTYKLKLFDGRIIKVAIRHRRLVIVEKESHRQSAINEMCDKLYESYIAVERQKTDWLWYKATTKQIFNSATTNPRGSRESVYAEAKKYGFRGR